jgi:hypothetical protein
VQLKNEAHTPDYDSNDTTKQLDDNIVATPSRVNTEE